MEGGLGAEYTPKPVYVHEELTLAMNPGRVRNLAYGAQTSTHTLILRGLATPIVQLPGGYSGTKQQVQVQTPARGLPTFRCPGTVGRMHGTLTGDDQGRWWFEADLDAEISAESAEFVSDWKAATAGSNHVIWTGKNNLHELEQVMEDIDALVAASKNPKTGVIVLGQWVTRNDLQKPGIIANVAEINRAQAAMYGQRFIDVQQLLTSDAGLRADPIWELNLLREADTLREREQGIVPTPLRGTDGIHLSGWGNLLVSWALIQRMKEMRWL